MSIEALKEQARGHEQREEWTDALQLYLQAISRLGEDDPDMGLYNRAGDLFTRVGNTDGAIEYYERAVDLYLEAELANNAIAILKKILRNVPDRKEVYLKMGQIRAGQGFLTDARGYFLGYAERTQKEGDLEEAFRALREFSDLAPDDLEIRYALAEQLRAHDRQDEALNLLATAFRRFEGLGQREMAAEVESRIKEMDPEYEIPEASEDELLGFETTSLAGGADSGTDGLELAADLGEIQYGDGDDDPESSVGMAGGLDLEHTSLAPTSEDPAAAEDTEEEAGDIEAGLADLEFDTADDDVEVWGAASSWSDDDEGEDDEEATELPLMDFGSDEPTAAGQEDEGGRWSDAGEETLDSADDVQDWDEPEMIGVPGVDAHPAFTHPEEPDALDSRVVAPHSAEEPATVAPETAPDGPIEAGLEADLEDRFEPQPDDSADIESPWQHAAADVSSFEDDDAWKADADTVVVEEPTTWSPEDALEHAFDDPAEWGSGFDDADDVSAPEPVSADTSADALESWQPPVEPESAAPLSPGSPHQGLPPLDTTSPTEDPAAAPPFEADFEGAGEGSALDAMSEVLSSDEDLAAWEPPVTDADSGNSQEARGLVGGADETVDDADATSAPSWVDLGAMVLDESREKTTRWNVESEVPETADDFDFQQMLAQFKEKVAENVEVGDVKAHYDLGTAFKEMGLVDEAITEFQQALRADGRNLATYEMLGQCFMEKGRPEVAVRSLTMATELPFEVEDELLGIYYYLGRAHEELGNRDAAVEFYEKVFALDINFQDVTERLRELR